jgi:uncharacterized protein
LQHASNPVDWYPWGEEAFTRARDEDRPIFLSIGYATCHWCHVMAHESFEDPEVAALMNEVFVNIKVDREERPDVDQVYMTACQMLTGSGGWPLTVLMTPDRAPFFVATYLPRASRPGRIGMLELIPRVRELWQTERDRVAGSASEIVGHLRSTAEHDPGGSLGVGVAEDTFRALAGRFDALHGGFGSQPKFPSPHNLLFLLQHWRRTGHDEALAMVRQTLGAMRRGGIYDHLGFGFHRYSTDAEWRLPHFEKMLYDQAMLTLAYVEAYAATGETLFARTAREILAYVDRELTSPEGAFYCAEDADSEGEEGRFYVWTLEELEQVLGADDARFAASAYGVRAEGNYRDEASGRATGANVLHHPEPLASLAAATGRDVDAFARRLEAIRQRLFEAREQRPRPLKDDKVLADWNGLMAAAMARAGAVLGEPSRLAAARRAVDFALTAMVGTDSRLLHRHRTGEASVPAFLDDYVFLTLACLELYDATLEVVHLERALHLQDETIRRFSDDGGGGFFFTADDAEQLLVRGKESFDGAIPSGNSVAMANLVRLSRLTGRVELAERARAVAVAFAGPVRAQPAAHAALVAAIHLAHAPTIEVVIAGDPDAGDTRRLLAAARSHARPGDTALILVPAGADASRVHRVAPFTASYGPVDGRAAAYVCRDFACQLPTTDPDTLADMLQGATPRS